MYVFSPIIFTEVNCVPAKLNYFVYEEQSTISSYHFNRYLEVVKEGCGTCFKDGRVIGFCTRAFQTHVVIEPLK